MRLLNINSMQIVSFSNHQELSSLKYAMLSHTWGHDEVTFQAFQHEPLAEQRRGYRKIWGCCEQAKRDRIDWVWIDTCCIDKTDSSELSEAINSMYSWYQSSAACYVYLEDVPPRQFEFPWEFDKARWFRRGWTLQELIAPRNLYFYAYDWSRLGSKWGLSDKIGQITGIPADVLLDGDAMKEYSIAQRMSWASGRDTARVEDEAYCLMGLFGVNMPLIYGEGRKAFQRLQHEILRQEEDFSFLLWVDKEHNVEDATVPVLAHSAKKFRLEGKSFAQHAQMDKVVKIPASSLSEQALHENMLVAWQNREPVQLTARGLRVRMWALRESAEFLRLWTEYEYDGYLACISVQRTDDEEREAYDRYAPWEIIWVKKESLADFLLIELYLTTDMSRVGSVTRPRLEKLHDRHSNLGITLSWRGHRDVKYIKSYPELTIDEVQTQETAGVHLPPDTRHMYCPDVGASSKTFMNSFRRHDTLILCFQVGESPSPLADDSWFGVRLWLEFNKPRCMADRWFSTDRHNGRMELHNASRLSNIREYKTATDCSEIEVCSGEVLVTVEIKHRRGNPLGDFIVDIVAYERGRIS